MKLNRSTLRHMILQEIRLLAEASELPTLTFTVTSQSGEASVKYVKQGTYDVKISYPLSTPRKIKFAKTDKSGKSTKDFGGKIDGKEKPSGVINATKDREVYFPKSGYYKIKKIGR